MTDEPDAGPPPPGTARGASGAGRAALGLAACVAFSSACIWGYVRLGAGAAGVAGLLVLLAPGAALATVFLVPRLRPFARARSWNPLLGLVLPFLLVSCELPELAGRRRFDPLSWQAAARGRSQARILQVDDLLASGALERRPRAAVLDLLGPDDGEHGTRWGSGYFTDWDLVYWLGNERGWLSIDSEWLVLRFDATGTVSELRIVRD